VRLLVGIRCPAGDDQRLMLARGPRGEYTSGGLIHCADAYARPPRSRGSVSQAGSRGSWVGGPAGMPSYGLIRQRLGRWSDLIRIGYTFGSSVGEEVAGHGCCE